LDDLYFPQDNDKIHARIIDGNLVFLQQMFPSSPDAPANRFIWMSWYDKHGNRKAKIDHLALDGYFYISAVPLGVIDGSLFISSKTWPQNKIDFEIIRIDPGLNQI
ncbi:hypothetical protein RZS08_48880, partial [Arthrospira platensis SPKY1]|nr:hypothetical protein [Arthrospira platensis SPKY1]